MIMFVKPYLRDKDGERVIDFFLESFGGEPTGILV